MDLSDDLPTTGTNIALCSGGRESTVASHISVRWGPCTMIAYLDTGTGAESNRRFVERVADTLGVPLFTIRTPEDYDEIVRKNGFPGPTQHGKMYSQLKERPIRRLATLVGGRGNNTELNLWTGVRLRESNNRMANVERVQSTDRWNWIAPIFDWTRQEVLQYHQRFNLPKSHLWSTLGRSADCFCGAYGTPEELIDAEAAGCETVVNQIRQLENEIQTDDETDRWGWAKMSDIEARAERIDDSQMTLCSDCGVFSDLETDS